MPLIDAGGVRLNVAQIGYRGDGPAQPLVMIHGLAANMAFWLMDYAQDFAARYALTLYDLRGHGRSETVPDGYTPDRMAGDLRALLDTLGIEKAHLMAHSFGGLAALKVASSAPDRVESLVICDTHIDSGRSRTAKEGSWETGAAVRRVLEECNIPLDVRDPHFGYRLITAIARIRVSQAELPPALLPWVRHILDGGNTRTAEKWLALMDETQAFSELTAADGLDADRLAAISCPVLLMYGEKSQALPSGRILAESLPDARLHVVADSGHFFPRFRQDEVKDACAAFWNGDMAALQKTG